MAEEPVGTALVLLVDVSGSIDENEYTLQRDGIGRALLDPAVAKAIWNQPYGAMAVAVVEWSSTQAIVVPWTIIRSAGDAESLAASVMSVRRSSAGGTYIGDAVVFALATFGQCGCIADRRVIDVSGDGANNGGQASVDEARELALAANVIINGLPIADAGEPDLAAYYREHVIGGPGSFITEANGFEDFARAMRHKLILEIASAGP